MKTISVIIKSNLCDQSAMTFAELFAVSATHFHCESHTHFLFGSSVAVV